MVKSSLKKTLMKLLWPYRKLRAVYNRIVGNKMRGNIRKRITHNRRIVILTNYPQGWNSFSSVYEEMKNNQDIEVILLAWIGADYPNNNEEFWRSIDNEAVISSPDEIIPLDSIHADIIFRQMPYDNEYPNEYSAKNICKISKLCYIPYGYEPSPFKHLMIEYNEKFFPFLYAIFCDNPSTKDFCDKKAQSSRFTADILRFDYGFPRFDIQSIEFTKKEYNVFLWLPRWSLDNTNNDGTSFFLLRDKLLEYFQSHSDKRLIIRPHPLMFQNFIRQNAMTEREIISFRKMIEEIPNIELDEQADYIPSFNSSDVLISDFSALIIEFFMTGKPILYCGSTREFNLQTQSILKELYLVDEWDSLKSLMDLLIKMRDPNLKKRLKLISNIKGDRRETPTSRIVNACLREL